MPSTTKTHKTIKEKIEIIEYFYSLHLKGAKIANVIHFKLFSMSTLESILAKIDHIIF